MAEAECGFFKAENPEHYKECYNGMLKSTVKDAEKLLKEMAELKMNIEMAEAECGFFKAENLERYNDCYNGMLEGTVKTAEKLLIEMIAEKTPKAREVIKEFNKAMIK